jgi:hypothetical protein
MSLLVDAITGWLTEAIGDASVKTGIRLILGSNEDRQLRRALHVAIDTDPGIIGSSRSFCTEIGISPGWLLRVLPEEVVRAVTWMAATKGGTLAPLANQLNADAILAAIHQLMTESKASSAVRSLPSDVSAFTGRESEMRKIRATATAASGAPILTITNRPAHLG